MYVRFSDVGHLDTLEFQGVAATDELQEDGFALSMAGADLSRFQGGTAPLLWQHNPNIVLGRIPSIRKTATSLPFRARFASPGISAAADEKRLLLKDGNLGAISLGFSIEATEPISPGRPRDGLRATKWTPLEISLVAIGMDKGAVVTARAAQMRARASTAPQLPLREQVARDRLARFGAVMAASFRSADWHLRQAEKVALDPRSSDFERRQAEKRALA